jgi:hypothetical protein
MIKRPGLVGNGKDINFFFAMPICGNDVSQFRINLTRILHVSMGILGPRLEGLLERRPDVRERLGRLNEAMNIEFNNLEETEDQNPENMPDLVFEDGKKNEDGKKSEEGNKQW